MQQQLQNPEASAPADDFVNFYTLVGVEPTTDPDAIQESINALYQDAQTNRDHRVPARRREYQFLLETLPQARAVLLDAKRRKRYDAYCNAVQMDAPRLPYPEFLSDLMRDKQADDGRSDILTLRDLSRLHLVSEPRVETAPASRANETSSAESVSEIAPAAEKPALTETAVPAENFAVPAPFVAPISTNSNSSPTWKAAQFSAPACIGGAVVLTGLIALLPSFTGLNLEIAAPLALIGGAVTAYVFSLANDLVSV